MPAFPCLAFRLSGPIWPLSGGHFGVILEDLWPFGFLFGTKIGAKSCPNRIIRRCGPYDALLTLVFASLALFGPVLVAILVSFWRLSGTLGTLLLNWHMVNYFLKNS